MDNHDVGPPATVLARDPDLRKVAEEYLDSLCAGVGRIDADEVAGVTRRLRALGRRRGVGYVFGNGGSATTAAHFVNDINRVVSTTGARLPVHCISENMSTVTAIANDYAVEDIFTRQLECYLEADDLVIGISTRGNSPNLVSAFRLAKERGAETIALVGFDGGKLLPLADHVVHIPVDDVQQIEDLQLAVCHMVSALLGAA